VDRKGTSGNNEDLQNKYMGVTKTCPGNQKQGEAEGRLKEKRVEGSTRSIHVRNRRKGRCKEEKGREKGGRGT